MLLEAWIWTGYLWIYMVSITYQLSISVSFVTYFPLLHFLFFDAMDNWLQKTTEIQRYVDDQSYFENSGFFLYVTHAKLSGRPIILALQYHIVFYKVCACKLHSLVTTRDYFFKSHNFLSKLRVGATSITVLGHRLSAGHGWHASLKCSLGYF